MARAAMPAFSRRHFERVLDLRRAGRAAGPDAQPRRRPGSPGEPDRRPCAAASPKGRSSGGNLTLLQCLVGTPYFPDLDGAILFLEDVGEDLYRVDRMLAHLRMVGALDRLAGVAVGRFTDLKRAMTDGALGFDEVLASYFLPLGDPGGLRLPGRPHRRPVDPAARRARAARRRCRRAGAAGGRGLVT